MRGHIAKKSNNYYAVIYDGINPATGKDRHRWYAAGPRRIDAERLANELVARRHNGEEAMSDRSTLGEYLTERWLPLQATQLRPKTLQSYRSIIELHIVPRIGRIRLAKLQADDLDGLYVQLLRDGDRRSKTARGLSPSSVRYVHRILRKALGDAHRKGIVTRNVATLADPPKPASSGEPTVLQVWNAAELSRFLRLTARHRHHDLWVVAAKTGMRRGELLGLRWFDIDFDRSTIAVHRSLGAIGTQLTFSDVKTRTGRRTIDIDARTLALLKHRREDAETASGDIGSGFGLATLIFAAPDGGPIRPGSVTGYFDRLVAKHDLPRIRFHDVRHTHATLLLKAGVPVKVVAERLGHASPGFTLNVYQHVLPGMQAEAAEIFDELLDDELEEHEPGDGDDLDNRSGESS